MWSRKHQSWRRQWGRWMGAAVPFSLVVSGCIVEEESAGRFDETPVEEGRGEEDRPEASPGDGGPQVETPGDPGDAPGDPGPGPGDPGGDPGCSYAAPSGCTNADTLPAMPGDEGNEQRVVRGTTNRFIKVFVSENVGSWVSHPELSFSAVLQNSSGMDFDLYVHQGGESPVCGEPFHVPNGPVTATWNDDLNSDDGMWWVFEVRHESGGACGAAAEWTLTINSNHAPSCETDNQCTTADHCVCSDCDTDEYCSNSCNDDGTCNSFTEGCGCADCAGTPFCL